MPREARVIESNVCYHVISRGNHSQIVFKKDNDYDYFLILIKKYKRHFKYKIFSYCLMPNHYHLLLDIEPTKALSNLMKAINQSYSIYFNRRNNLTGHLWQGRFKSMLISKDDYLLNCIQYIEYNPVRAKIVRKPDDYKWCSYKARILGHKNGILSRVKEIGDRLVLS